MMPTLTGFSRQREQQRQSILLDRLVFKYEKRIAREIKRAMFLSAKYIEMGASGELALFDHVSRLEKLMLPMYRDTAQVFYNYMANISKGRLKRQTIDPTVIVTSIMSNWIRAYGSTRIVLIAETTKKQIAVAVADGIVGGKNEKEIAKIIRLTAPSIGASRAQTIARTETHAAANATTFETANASGFEMVKEWVAAENSRTRESHRRASGQKVEMEDMFNVGGYQMRYPSDPSAPASETINCRCVLVYDLP